MANDVKWTDWRSSDVEDALPEAVGTNPRTALLQLLGCVVGLSALALVLPGPVSWVDALSGRQTGTQGPVSITATAETAILVTASVLVWLLLAWVMAVWIAAVAGRLPGAPGRCGRALLRRIAPATAGRIVAAAVGVSLLAGTSACAVPALGDPGSGASTGAVATSITTSTPAPLGGGAGVVDTATSTAAATPTATDPASLDDVLSSISIDWPAVGSPTGAVDTAPQPTPDVPAAITPATTTTAATTTPADSTAPDPAPPDPAPTGIAPLDPPRPAAPSKGSTGVAPALPTTGAPTDPDQKPANTTQPTSEPANPVSGVDSPGRVAVRSGDTLWSIAHHHLGPDATDQEIDTAWRAWYSANAPVIGDNPDLIQPGQLLLPPDPEMGR